MLKWMSKLIGGSETSTEKRDERAGAAARKLEEEPPLQAPAVGLRDEAEEAAANSGFLSRHVLINRECHPVGYFFAMRDRARARMAGLDQASAKINDQLMVRAVNGLGLEKIARFRQVWLEVVDAFLINPLIESLPAKATVIIVRLHGSAAPDPVLLERAAVLRKKGFRFALSRWVDNAACRAWQPLVDFVVVDVSGLNPVEITERANELAQKMPDLGLLAMHVDSLEEFECCQRAPFTMYQGGFLTRRENWPPQPQMSPQRLQLTQLLQRLQSGGEINEISEALRHSPELAYRLLRYINSAGMGLTTRIASIEQALLLLGREKLYRWLTLLLFSAGKERSIDNTLLEQALVRARFMELLAPDSYSSIQRDELFIVGIFSLLDILLKLPLSVALEPLQLPMQVSDALLKDDGAYAPYLRLALASETHDAEAMAKAAEAMKKSVALINTQHMEALSWAQETLAPAEPE